MPFVCQQLGNTTTRLAKNLDTKDSPGKHSRWETERPSGARGWFRNKRYFLRVSFLFSPLLTTAFYFRALFWEGMRRASVWNLQLENHRGTVRCRLCIVQPHAYSHRESRVYLLWSRISPALRSSPRHQASTARPESTKGNVISSPQHSRYDGAIKYVRIFCFGRMSQIRYLLINHPVKYICDRPFSVCTTDNLHNCMYVIII